MLSVILTMNMNMSMLCLWLYAYHKGSSISIDLGLLVVQQERKGENHGKYHGKAVSVMHIYFVANVQFCQINLLFQMLALAVVFCLLA